MNYEDWLSDEGGVGERSLRVKEKVLRDVAVRWHFLTPGEELIVVRVKGLAQTNAQRKDRIARNNN